MTKQNGRDVMVVSAGRTAVGRGHPEKGIFRDTHPNQLLGECFEEPVNVNGGAMAIGHPLGSRGARLITTLIHELERRDSQTGLVTMCCAGDIGTATLVERV